MRLGLEERFARFLQPLEEWVRSPEGGIALDASGNGPAGDSNLAHIFEVKAGFKFQLHRLVIDLPGFTPASPYTSATGYAEIQRNGRMVDMYLFSNGLPAVYSAADEGPYFFGNESVSLLVVGGPVSSTLFVDCEGLLSADVNRDWADSNGAHIRREH